TAGWIISVSRSMISLDTGQRLGEIIDLDSEMIQPAVAAVTARNAIQPNITVADHDRACRARLAGCPHAEERLIKPAVLRVIIAGNGNVINPCGHMSVSFASCD